MKALLRKLANAVANEPVVLISGGIQSAVVWLFTYVVTGWDPSTHQQQLAGFATAGAYALSLIARQFVSPVAKTSPPSAVLEPGTQPVPVATTTAPPAT